MKAQILTNFVIECTASNDKEVWEQSKKETLEPAWILLLDGASNIQGCGADLILTNIDVVVTKYALQFAFKASNNQTEYKVLIANLKMAMDLSMKRLKVFFDSQLVTGQA